MIGILVFIMCISVMSLICYLAFVKGPRDLKRDKKIHNRYYNSLDPNSKYSERECCGKDCGCHSKEPKDIDFKSSGDM